jgi:hypothetical protein
VKANAAPATIASVGAKTNEIRAARPTAAKVANRVRRQRSRVTRSVYSLLSTRAWAST